MVKAAYHGHYTHGLCLDGGSCSWRGWTCSLRSWFLGLYAGLSGLAALQLTNLSIKLVQRQLGAWHGMYLRLVLCLVRAWELVLGRLGVAVPLPSCARALHSPSTLEGRVWWLPLTGLSWLPYAFSSVALVSPTSF